MRKGVWVIIIFLSILYFLTRLINLTILPIFFDEANYIFWAKRIASANSHWFLPLAYGKPVPFIWLIVLMLKILPSNLYLIAGRLPSVFFGLITLIGIYKLGKSHFSKSIGLAACLLYILSPFALFYDRLALYDSIENIS